MNSCCTSLVFKTQWVCKDFKDLNIAKKLYTRNHESIILLREDIHFACE